MGKRLLLIICLSFVVGGLVLLPLGTASAQTKVEICDNKVDDDGDGLIDENDPDCKKTPPPPPGIPCSPGFWKAEPHRDEFNAACVPAGVLAASLGLTALDSCDELFAAVSCKGADATCLRSLAASLLNTVSGCTED
jgi:hypothetical protein